MLQDLRFAVRLLIKERWFSAVAIVALSLGIGLNATVFTLVNAVLIRGLPFKDSQDLYMLGWQHKRGGSAPASYQATIAASRSRREGRISPRMRSRWSASRCCSAATSDRRTSAAAPTVPSSSAIGSGATATPAILRSSESSPA